MRHVILSRFNKRNLKAKRYYIVQEHKASKWQSQDFNPSFIIQTFLHTLSYISEEADLMLSLKSA